MKNWHSIAASGNGQVAAVASRSGDKAQAFIDACTASVPVPHQVDALGSYDELISRDDIQAVYIPLPTGIRKEWVIRAAEAGRHVMVEKPCGVSAADVQQMIAACEQNGVQFMDGVMFMHSQRLPVLRDVLDDGQSVGQIRRIVSQFSFCADEDWIGSNIRANSDLEPAGCLGDLGWYTIRMTLWAMKNEMPTEVSGRILTGVKRDDSPQEVPIEFQGEMHFASGVSAVFYNSFRTNHQQLVHISGDKGYVELNDFVLPFYGNRVSFEVGNHEFGAEGCRFIMDRNSRFESVSEYSNNMANAQETNLFRCFSALVNEGRVDSFWPDVSLKTQQILDASLQSAHNGGQAVSPG
jgi:predicted dehydrogenase